jgi:hypothetical protein
LASLLSQAIAVLFLKVANVLVQAGVQPPELPNGDTIVVGHMATLIAAIEKLILTLYGWEVSPVCDKVGVCQRASIGEQDTLFAGARRQRFPGGDWNMDWRLIGFLGRSRNEAVGYWSELSSLAA